MHLKPQALPIPVLLYCFSITRSCSSPYASTSTSAFEQFWNIFLCLQLQKASGPDGPWLFSFLPSCLTPYLLASFYGFCTQALSFQFWGLVHSSLHPRTWYSSWCRVGSSPTIHRMHWPLAELFRPQQHCMLVCKSVTDVVLGKRSYRKHVHHKSRLLGHGFRFISLCTYNISLLGQHSLAEEHGILNVT